MKQTSFIVISFGQMMIMIINIIIIVNIWPKHRPDMRADMFDVIHGRHDTVVHGRRMVSKVGVAKTQYD